SSFPPREPALEVRVVRRGAQRRGRLADAGQLGPAGERLQPRHLPPLLPPRVRRSQEEAIAPARGGPLRVLTFSRPARPAEGALTVPPRRAPRDLRRPETSPPERHDRFRRLYEAARSFVFRLAPDGRLRELVPAPDNLMGRPLAEWMGVDFVQFVAEPDVPRAREMLARVLAGEKPPPFFVRFRSPTGELRHVEFIVVPDED